MFCTQIFIQINQLTNTIIQLRYPDLEQIINLFIQYPNETRQFYLQKLSQANQPQFDTAVEMLTEYGVLFQIQIPVIRSGRLTNKNTVIYHLIHNNLINFEMVSLPTAYLPQHVARLYTMIALKPGMNIQQLQQQCQQIENSSSAEKQIISKNMQQYINSLSHMQLIVERQDFPSNQQIITCINEYFSQNNYNPNEIKNKKMQGLKPEITGILRKLLEGKSEYRDAQQYMVIRNNEQKIKEENINDAQDNTTEVLKKEESQYILNLQNIPKFIQLNVYAQQIEQKFDKQAKILFMLHFLAKPNYNNIMQIAITQNQLKETILCISETDVNILGLKTKQEINENILLGYFDILEKYGALQQNYQNYYINWDQILYQNKNQVTLQLLSSRYNSDSARIVYCLENSNQPLSIEKIYNLAVVDINTAQQNIFKLISEGWIQQQGQLYVCNNGLAFQVSKNILSNSLSNILKKQHQLQQISIENKELTQISQSVEQLKGSLIIFI